MVKGTKKLRLDEILVQEGLITEEQIKEALSRQKERGGKFGSQLLFNHYIDEAGLVRALSKQFNCDGVVLSKLDVPEIILKFIPRRLAIARKIIPFDYDLDNNILKIACEDPTDESLINEIGFVARGKEVKFFIAAELALNTAIAKFYMGRNVSMEDDLLLDIPRENTEPSSKPQETVKKEPAKNILSPDETKTVLLVTDDVEAGPLLKTLLEDDSYHVMLTDSADDAIEMIAGQTFHTVLIKDTVPGDYLDLIDRLRKVSPSTIVRYYESTSSLLLDDDSLPVEEGLLRKNLELYTYLLHAKDNLPADHTCVMGRYVNMLCQRMELPYKDRLAVVNAAYLHDVARHYYDITDAANREQTSGLTVKLLKSLGYSPVVVEMLRKMYKNLKGKYTQRLPVEILGANILTIVDTFLVNYSATGRLSLDKLDSAQKKLREQTGSLLLTEVVEAFIGLLKDEILKFHSEQNASQIMVFSRVPQMTEMIETRIKNEGFRVLSTESIDKLAELYDRSRPDIIILVPDIEVSYLNSFLDELSNRDINFEKTPTFIMKNGVPSPMLISLFELGIEDVITIDGNFELLIAKICRIQSQLRSKAMQQNVLTEHASSTSGNLEDIRLTDLIQGLSTGRRTAKLTVTPNQTNPKELTVFFRKGNIVFARQDKLIGEDAIYSGATWTEGVWTVETVGEQDLPDSNIDRSNETIQINTYRLLDEKPKSDQPV